MDWIDLLQWPAMVITVAASWYVASERKSKRNWGFWLFLVSNALWIVWGLSSGATALVVLQFCLTVMNIRGAMKASKASKASKVSSAAEAAAAGSGRAEASEAAQA